MERFNAYGAALRGFQAVALLFLIGFMNGAKPQAPQSAEAEAQRPYQFSVNVDLVTLIATVRDRKGHVASDLREGDFHVYEDGVRQAIRFFRHEDIPVTVGLVVDHSGSMRPKLTDVVVAARTFVRFSSPRDEMFVVNFNERVSMGLLGTTRLTNRADELGRAISDAPAMGKTALYDAVVAALTGLRAGGPEKKVLIVISDGGDNASTHSLDFTLKMAAQSRALVYAIGIFDDGDPDQNPGVLRRLALATGGEAFFPAELPEVTAICERIARDIRNQYTLGYVPSNPAKPGAWRRIRVDARRTGSSKLIVGTRSGYTADGKSGPVADEGEK